VTPLKKRAVSGSDKGGSDASRGSDEAKNHFPSLPARANQEAGLVPTPRYGRGSDLEVILEVIGSADRLPSCSVFLILIRDPVIKKVSGAPRDSPEISPSRPTRDAICR